MKIKLKSDYFDKYDAWFDLSGEIHFSRMAQNSWHTSRDLMFEIFQKLGLKTPRYGFMESFEPDDMIVLYTDEYAHCGEGKLLIKAGDAHRLSKSALMAAISNETTHLSTKEVDQYIKKMDGRVGAPEAFGNITCRKASEYIADFPGVSWRALSCGGHLCWFRHWSTEDWRSNAGDGELSELISSDIILPSGFEKMIQNPVWAIDFIGQKNDDGQTELLAIDFNTAPKIAGTPLVGLLSPKTMAADVRTQIEQLIQDGHGEKTESGVILFDNNKIIIRG
jgi:hypothetical protein